ncbi:MAG TPA: ImmA/IrrE family metallo-endopeptidase [Cellulomonas sp.]
MTSTTEQLRQRRTLLRHTRTEALERLRHLRSLRRRPSWRKAKRLLLAQASTLAADAKALSLEPDHYIALLPEIRIERVPNMPAAVLSFYDRGTGQFVIHVRSAEPREEQRYQILTELKRILDHPMFHRLYSPEADVCHAQAQLAADLFAASVLMPERGFRAAVRSCGADLIDLAIRFGVTKERALQRLIALDLNGHIKGDRPKGDSHDDAE